MHYILAFLEGIITFISPCILPMIPIFISYFAGQSTGENARRPMTGAFGFVLGFTLVFTLMGAFAGQLGGFLTRWQTALNIISGLILIALGLNFIGLIRLPFINNIPQPGLRRRGGGFFGSLLFGVVFSISWTPCVGTFLGSALMLAAVSGNNLQGVVMLLCYSLGLGIPFLLSALLIDRLKNAFDAIKRNYKTITAVSGGLLIVLGILVATGAMNSIYALL